MVRRGIGDLPEEGDAVSKRDVAQVDGLPVLDHDVAELEIGEAVCSDGNVHDSGIGVGELKMAALVCVERGIDIRFRAGCVALVGERDFSLDADVSGDDSAGDCGCWPHADLRVHEARAVLDCDFSDFFRAPAAGIAFVFWDELVGAVFEVERKFAA